MTAITYIGKVGDHADTGGAAGSSYSVPVTSNVAGGADNYVIAVNVFSSPAGSPSGELVVDSASGNTWGDTGTGTSQSSGVQTPDWNPGGTDNIWWSFWGAPMSGGLTTSDTVDVTFPSAHATIYRRTLLLAFSGMTDFYIPGVSGNDAVSSVDTTVAPSPAGANFIEPASNNPNDSTFASDSTHDVHYMGSRADQVLAMVIITGAGMRVTTDGFGDPSLEVDPDAVVVSTDTITDLSGNWTSIVQDGFSGASPNGDAIWGLFRADWPALSRWQVGTFRDSPRWHSTYYADTLANNGLPNRYPIGIAQVLAFAPPLSGKGVVFGGEGHRLT
jgi:hypothetical protein